MLCEKYLRNVPLPDDLTNDNIYQAMRKTQDIFALIHENTGLNLTDFIQANSFSGMVSNIYTKMLGEISVYRPYHDQRYPDLMHENKKIGLEIKASNKPMKGGSPSPSSMTKPMVKVVGSMLVAKRMLPLKFMEQRKLAI